MTVNTGGNPAWERSPRCESASCVEVAGIDSDGAVQVRDSKNPDGPVLTFSRTEWDAFTAWVGNR